ncbi:Uncharacterised protein [Mycobacteroides abscessus subsp. abscessus]|nr:Uncharacterised protein [Mycobacteroides abscessus subsp. abscessus]
MWTWWRVSCGSPPEKPSMTLVCTRIPSRRAVRPCNAGSPPRILPMASGPTPVESPPTAAPVARASASTVAPPSAPRWVRISIRCW